MPIYHHQVKIEQGEPAIPTTFDSNTPGGGYVLVASHNAHDAGADLYKMFLQNYTSNENCWWSGSMDVSEDNPAWVSIEFPKAFKPSGIFIMNEIATPVNFKNAVFQGSNDGTKWDDLFTITDSPNVTGYKQEHSFVCKAAYKIFRIYFTASHDRGVSVQAFQIYGTPQYTITGFDDMGFAVPYDSASEAGCALTSWMDDNTIFYLPMYGDSPFVDQSASAFTLDNTGVTSVSGITPPSGGDGAAYFNGSVCLLNTEQGLLSGLGEFTVELDYKLDNVPSGDAYNSSYYILSCGPSMSDPGTDFFIGASGITVSFNNYPNRHLIACDIDSGVWHTLKITRDSSGLVSVYIDNDLKGVATDQSAFDTSNNLCIGRCEPVGEESGYFCGYMANYRISNIVR